MLAVAFPKGRTPLQLPPPPPQKPMPAGNGNAGRGSCRRLSCFGGSPVADLDAGKPVAHGGRRAPWFTWSGFRKKKKTVPLDSSSTELIPGKIITPGGGLRQRPGAGEDQVAAGSGGQGAEEEEPGKQPQWPPTPTKTPLPPPAVEVTGQSFFRRLWKGNKVGSRSKTQPPPSHEEQVSTSHRKRRPQQQQQQPRLPCISPKYDARRRTPAPSPPERPRTASRAVPTPAANCTPSASSSTANPAPTKPPANQAGASRPGGPRPHKKPEESFSSSSPSSHSWKNDQVVGLSVLVVVVLLMMVLFGRMSAIICTCAWFYFLPRLRVASAETDDGGSKSCAAIDFDSEEYKKRVVLEGLLQRNGKRPAGAS